jgi:hypothetical protein
MRITRNNKVVFTTGEIAQAISFVGEDKDNAGAVFGAWIDENKDWVNAGGDFNAVEIVGIDFQLVEFNGQVIISWLCAECENEGCDKEGDTHEEILSDCKFEQVRFVSEASR